MEKKYVVGKEAQATGIEKKKKKLGRASQGDTTATLLLSSHS